MDTIINQAITSDKRVSLKLGNGLGGCRFPRVPTNGERGKQKMTKTRGMNSRNEVNKKNDWLLHGKREMVASPRWIWP